MNVIEKMQEREDCVLGGFVLSTDEYPLDSNYCFVLKVSECKHFKCEGIRKGSLVITLLTFLGRKPMRCQN